MSQNDPRIDPNVERFLPLAAKMAGLAEVDGLRRTLAMILHRHQRAWMAGTRCSICSEPAPCERYLLAAAQMSILELLDGTRFSMDWPGPVEERRW